MADIKYLDYSGLEKLGALINKKFAAGISGTLSTSSATIFLNNNTPATTASGAVSPDMFESIDSVVIPSATQSLAGLMSSTDKKKLDGIAEGANKYVHPTSAGNKHIPSGGSSGQFLGWDSAGTAKWVSNPNTDTKLTTASITADTAADTPTGDTIDVVQNSAVTLTGTNGKSVSGAFTAVSVPTKKYIDNIKSAIDTSIANLTLSALELKGTIDNTSAAKYTPAATKGDVYFVKGSKTINGQTVEPGDAFVCIADSVAAATSSNYTTIQASWHILNTNWSTTNASATLKWNEAVTIATVGGVNITAKLPTNPNSNTWRPVSVNGTSFKGSGIDTNTINFKGSGSVSLSTSGNDLIITGTNTTYSFAGGTNCFTVTPSGGTAQTVSVTPSITNNVTYSSTTSGNVAIFDSTAGVIKASGFTIASSVPANAKFTDNNTWRQIKVNGTERIKTSASTALNFVNGNLTTATWNATNKTVQYDHNAPTTSPAGTYGPTANATDNTTATSFSVPQITVDAYGHVTSVTARTWTSNTYTAITEDEIKEIFGVS